MVHVTAVGYEFLEGAGVSETLILGAGPLGIVDNCEWGSEDLGIEPATLTVCHVGHVRESAHCWLEDFVNRP